MNDLARKRFGRREVLQGTLAAGLVIGGARAGAALAAPAAVAGQAPMAAAGGPLPAVLVFDSRLLDTEMTAVLKSVQSTLAIDVAQHDLGLAWQKWIPDALASQSGGIAGMTSWSSRFICESFARDLGLVPADRQPLFARLAPAGLAENAQQWWLA